MSRRKNFQNTEVSQLWPFISFQPLNAGQQNFVNLNKKDQRPFPENLTANGLLGKKVIVLFPWEWLFVREFQSFH